MGELPLHVVGCQWPVPVGSPVAFHDSHQAREQRDTDDDAPTSPEIRCKLRMGACFPANSCIPTSTPGGSLGEPHLTHPEAEGPLPGVLLLQVQVGVEEDEEDVALQVLQAPQLQRPRLPLILARLALGGTTACLRHLWHPQGSSCTPPSATALGEAWEGHRKREEHFGDRNERIRPARSCWGLARQALISLWFPVGNNIPRAPK